MLKLILFRFWPALIPIALYLLWKWLRKPDASYSDVIDAEKAAPHWIKGPFFWVLTLSFVILIACFIGLSVDATTNRDGQYVPPAVKDGRLIDGHIE